MSAERASALYLYRARLSVSLCLSLSECVSGAAVRTQYNSTAVQHRSHVVYSGTLLLFYAQSALT